jgi:hypothetical protein
MTHVIVERDLAPAVTAEQVFELAEQAGGCFELYQIDWLFSFLAQNGDKMVCQFQAPDTETARTALRQTNNVVRSVWPATVHLGPEADLTPNVMVERTFEQAVTLDSIQAMEDAAAQCLKIRDVSFVKTYFSIDQKRMLCLYSAPDAEAVRSAQDEAQMPFDQVWSCQTLQPPSE